ncbi:MAG: hypothetical protein JWQ49_3359, partial [Edaphobacter sp.]|nr:hypothetical protein [Edaphobacter sp.]
MPLIEVTQIQRVTANVRFDTAIVTQRVASPTESGPSQRVEAAAEEASSRARTLSIRGWIEGMMLHPKLWQGHSGASHRKKIDTPPLRGSCGGATRIRESAPTDLNTYRH